MCRKGGPYCEKKLSRQAANAYISRRGKMKDYYAATDRRHLPSTRSHAAGIGSQFQDTSLTSVNDVLVLAWQQRPDKLAGDDREELIRRGAPPDAFHPHIRYLIVETPGTVGITRSESFPDDTIVSVTRTKPDTPCTLSIALDDAPTTDYGTIIIGPHETIEGKEILYTVHPGHPIPVNLTGDTRDMFAHREGQTLTLGEIRAALGRELWLQTRPNS